MKSWQTVPVTVAILVIGALFGYIIYVKAHTVDVCADSVEIRGRADSEFKCHKDAVLTHQRQDDEHVLVTCTCKR